MTYLNTLLQSQPSMNLASGAYHYDHASTHNSFLLRFGQREIAVCQDFRKRFYTTNPIIECRAGVNAGHVEILLLRRWLVIFSKAQH